MQKVPMNKAHAAVYALMTYKLMEMMEQCKK